MTSFLMVVESAGLGELLLTKPAPERFLPTVSPAVSSEGGDIRETPTAQSAGVGFLPRMNPLMELQICLPSKLLVTFSKGAMKRLFSCVDPHMLLKFIFLVEYC